MQKTIFYKGDFILKLNDMQQRAVDYDKGALLILAGAGSGKTRVITERIARLVADGVKPWEILAITFTNKAATEMKERVSARIAETAQKVWISTFHSFCVRVLRRHAENIGYHNNFTIYDTGDKNALIEDCRDELGISKDYYKTNYLSAEISSAKDRLLSPQEYEDKYSDEFRLQEVSRVYELYQQRMLENNAMDFDDLIFNCIKLFKKEEDILNEYSEKFRFIMVDEYQDTSLTQYELIRLISKVHKNLVVVGDDDQSIYAWRGADIRNILDFEKDFEGAEVIKLEQNYRSTSNILSAANSVIANNMKRKGKNLWTDSGSGEKVTVYKAVNESDEANFVAEKIEELKSGWGLKNSDFAILYRMNALSRKFEENLVRKRLPYRVYGGFKFFERAEVKDIIAYLRLIDNPLDEISLKRVVNTPKRGIGKATVDKVESYARQASMPMMDVIDSIKDFDMGAAASKSLQKFSILIGSLKAQAKILTASDLIEKVIENSGYANELRSDNDPKSKSRMENIQELVSVAKEFEVSNEDKSLSNFLGTASLSTDMDDKDEGESISLMTVHSAKGLEFPVVFIVGAEEGIFPSSRSIDDEDKLDEERRLCYVAITRAEKKLYITHCHQRMLYGKTNAYIPSRFLDEISDEHIEIKESPFGSTNFPSGWSGAGNTCYSIKDKYLEKYRIRKEQEKQKAPDGTQDIELNSKVKHKIFGKGTVVAKKDSQYTIVFEGIGIKKIDTAMVRLEILD